MTRTFLSPTLNQSATFSTNAQSQRQGEQQRLELWQNRHFTISHAKQKFLNASKCQFSIFFLVFKCIQWFTNTQILWKDSQMTQIFISWFNIFTHEQMFDKKLAILCNQKRQNDNLLKIWQDDHLNVFTNSKRIYLSFLLVEAHMKG